MNRLFYLLCLLPLLFCSCKKKNPQLEVKKLVEEFHQGCEQNNYLIEHDRLVPSPASLNLLDSLYFAELFSFAKAYNTKLSEFEKVELNPAMQFEYTKISKAVKSICDTPTQELRIQHQDASLYDVGPALRQQLLNKNWQQLQNDLGKVPPYYNIAKQNLLKVAPEILEQAVDQNSNTYFLLTGQLQKAIANQTIPDTSRQQFHQLTEQARLAIKDYMAYCNSLKFEHHDHEQQVEQR